MDIKQPLITFVSFVVLPTYIAMFWFRVFGVPIRSSLSRTIQANFLLFGVIAVLPVYFLFFQCHDYVSGLTPVRALFSPDAFKSVSDAQVRAWIRIIAEYNAWCFAWFLILVAIAKQVIFRRRLGKSIAGFLGTIFEAADIWSGEETMFQTGRDGNSRLILDVLGGDGKVLYSGFFAGFSDREGDEGNGFFLRDVKKFRHDGTEVADSDDSSGQLKRMFFPWHSVSNVNLRNSQAGDANKIRKSLKVGMESAKKKHAAKGKKKGEKG